MTDPNTTLDRFATKACRLYSLPAVAMKVLELTENPQVDTRALKQCIETDPALTGKVLRVVNSSLYGLSREVSDLNQALALLGTKPLKLLVLGFSLPPGLFEGLAGNVLLQYWRHTLVKAVAAREICEMFSSRPGDEAFIAGLLQDLGTLLLIQEMGEPYVRFLETIAREQADPAELERQSLGFDRTQLSARLLAHWHLPHVLVEAVSLEPDISEDSAEGSVRLIRRVLRVAELTARLFADGQPGVLARLLEEGGRFCGLTETQLEALVENLEQKVQQLADALTVELPGDVDYRDLLSQAQQRLAEVAAEVAGDLVATQARSGHGCQMPDAMVDLRASLAETAGRVTGRPLTPGPMPDDAAEVGRPAEPRPPSGCKPVDLAENLQGASAPAQRSIIASAHLSAPGTAETSPMPLAAYVGAASAACRRSRVPLSLMLVEINHPETLILAGGRKRFLEVRDQLEAICRSVDHALCACLPRGQFGFALILSDCERQAAVRLGQELIETVCRMNTADPITVSVGVASVSLAPVNFDPDVMLEAAGRCVYGARASGGSVVKSIEIY